MDVMDGRASRRQKEAGYGYERVAQLKGSQGIEMSNWILWLQEITADQRTLVGGKAAALGLLLRAGLPVLPGFCLTTAAYHAFLAANGQDDSLDVPPTAGQGLHTTLLHAEIPADLRQELFAAYYQLLQAEPATARVVVRSSATAEDQLDASFAGQAATMLNIGDEAGLLDAVRFCWASLWSPRALAYRQRQGGTTSHPAMALLVQPFIPVEAGGVAFSRDPLQGAELVVLEAAWGLTGGVVHGETTPDRYTLSPDASAQGWKLQKEELGEKALCRQPCTQANQGTELRPVPDSLRSRFVLSPEEAGKLASMVKKAEEVFGHPQDIEWGQWQGRVFILQSRPITTLSSGYFTASFPSDNELWTAGFLNERFPQPVSPLGWSLVRPFLEELAFRDPLRYMGVPLASEIPLTKLYRGHPYINLAIFQMLYKPFPELFLPEDAHRYFPGGDASLRRRVPFPRPIWHPGFWLPMMRAFLTNREGWLPWRHYRLWRRFMRRHQEIMADLQARLDAPKIANHEGHEVSVSLWETISRARALDVELLRLHRWSLTHADLSYSLLRRALSLLKGRKEAAHLAATLVSDTPNLSLQMNQALQELAALAMREGQSPPLSYEAIQAGGGPLAEALASFLERYGHRSFGLDIRLAPFAADPAQVMPLLDKLIRAWQGEKMPNESRPSPGPNGLRQALGRGWRARLAYPFLALLLHWARRYMALREDQRFHWQQSLALQRACFLSLGEKLARDGILDRAEDIFFATISEIEDCVTRGVPLPVRQMRKRRGEHARLLRDEAASPALAYPPFLQGNRPLISRADSSNCWQGKAVSPGLARGPVKVVISPERLAELKAGDILVTRGADPGWTPVFGTLGGLILECGGLLSHGAVVAREYGLPAVANLPGITSLLKDGDIVLLDAYEGAVLRE